jgi:hypothetical protein
MHFYSGPPVHFLSGVDSLIPVTRDVPERRCNSSQDLDQACVVVLDVADALADRPRRHLSAFAGSSPNHVGHFSTTTFPAASNEPD